MATKKQLTEEQVKAEVEPKVLEVKTMEIELAKLEHALSKNSQFRKFLDLQKALKETSDKVWASVLEQMVQNDVKSIKGSWGSITKAHKKKWTVVDDSKVPEEFKTLEVDTKKLSQHFDLTEELPEGVKLDTTVYLHKKFN